MGLPDVLPGGPGMKAAAAVGTGVSEFIFHHDILFRKNEERKDIMADENEGSLTEARFGRSLS